MAGSSEDGEIVSDCIVLGVQAQQDLDDLVCFSFRLLIERFKLGGGLPFAFGMQQLVSDNFDFVVEDSEDVVEAFYSLIIVL